MFAASRSLKYCSLAILSKSSPPLQSLEKSKVKLGVKHLLSDEEVALVVLEELVKLQDVRVVEML
jgi:hypothetical protein